MPIRPREPTSPHPAAAPERPSRPRSAATTRPASRKTRTLHSYTPASTRNSPSCAESVRKESFAPHSRPIPPPQSSPEAQSVAPHPARPESARASEEKRPYLSSSPAGCCARARPAASTSGCRATSKRIMPICPLS